MKNIKEILKIKLSKRKTIRTEITDYGQSIRVINKDKNKARKKAIKCAKFILDE